MSIANAPQPALLIGGRRREASDGGTADVINPATEEVITAVPSATTDDVHAAVSAARAQFDGGPWSRWTGTERSRLLHRLADLVEEDAPNLAAIEATEVGKPYGEALHADLPAVVETFRHFAGWADRLNGEHIPVPDFDGRQRFSYTRREPLGVVAAITPWNAPTMIASWKIAPAVATGCTVVMKPALEAPLSTLRLGELLDAAGLPPGVINLLPGTGDQAGSALVNHPGIDKVSFTGSVAVGRQIGAAAGAQLKSVSLELGGKSAQMVFEDADLDRVLPQIALSVFANQGQTCASGSRVLVHRPRLREVLDGLAAIASQARLGNPFDEQTTMGPVISEGQQKRIESYFDYAVEDGAELVAGGRPQAGTGYFVEPTVFGGSNTMRIARDEIFGPVATVIPFEDESEAVALANDSDYGLTSVIWGDSLSRAHRVAARLRVGSVWINGWGTPDPRLPWSGRGLSGLGSELGKAGIDSHTVVKAVSAVL